MTIPATYFGRLSHTARRWAIGWRRIGVQTQFYATTLRYIPDAVLHYRTETLRLIAQMGLGTGALAVIGGTVAIVAFLTMTTGALSAVIGYNQLADIGVEALTGFASAYFNVRLAAPLTSGIALAATIGAGATAQLGAMRINEEIDALESMAIRPIPYLAATRVIASVVAAIPMFLACLAVAYMSSELAVWLVSDLSPGTYSHYFSMFVSGTDVMYATIKAAVFVFVSSTLQCYFGYFASGGPAGVGVAAGHAMRAAITVVIVLNMLLTMGLWGLSAGARFGG